jgi:tRNA pseudouridine32 synthase/23S rRNA pseudouridine746 synthase
MNSYSRSLIPSYVTLPEGGTFATVYQFVLARFPRIPEPVWRERMELHKVHFDDGELIGVETPYQEHRRVCYYREVLNEQNIPFEEEILFENDDFLVVDKPPFLPVHPAGKYVNETLITRLRAKTGCEELGSAHRIDRLTSGLVLCVKRRATRGLYQKLFMDGAVTKVYLAAGMLPEDPDQTHWRVRARMEPYDDHFRMRVVPGAVNSESLIELVESRDDIGLFRLQPVTGKKHQLRVHLCEIGSGILNDPWYPELSGAEAPDHYDRPMQLLAYRLAFTDPVTGDPMSFRSKLSLSAFPDSVAGML